MDIIQASFQESINKIDSKIDTKVDELKQQIKENETQITVLTNFKDETEVISSNRDEQYQELTNRIINLEDELDEMRNRTMRSTLVFKNITKSRNEKNWQNTTDTLIGEIKKVLPEDSFEKIDANISRAHRGKEKEEENSENTAERHAYQTPEPIFANFVNWRYAERVKEKFIEASRKKQTKIIVSNLHSKKLQTRINEALKLRRELLEDRECNKQLFVKYPADLMGKTKNTNEKYKLVKRF